MDSPVTKLSACNNEEIESLYSHCSASENQTHNEYILYPPAVFLYKFQCSNL